MKQQSPDNQVRERIPDADAVEIICCVAHFNGVSVNEVLGYPIPLICRLWKLYCKHLELMVKSNGVRNIK